MSILAAFWCLLGLGTSGPLKDRNHGTGPKKTTRIACPNPHPGRQSFPAPSLDPFAPEPPLGPHLGYRKIMASSCSNFSLTCKVCLEETPGCFRPANETCDLQLLQRKRNLHKGCISLAARIPLPLTHCISRVASKNIMRCQGTTNLALLTMQEGDTGAKRALP